MKKYHVGYVFDHGGVIVDGPLRLVGKKGNSYIKWKLRCPNCKTEDWKFSNTLMGKKYPCKRCYDKSMRREDFWPAVKKAFISIRSNARARGIEVGLSEKDYFKIATNECFYCGIPPQEKPAPKDWQPSVFLHGLDRVDNSKGYFVENCVSCCYQCNWSKRDLSLEDWKGWISRIMEKNK
jgi:hypothetical protein